jgi:hypothetical protein
MEIYSNTLSFLSFSGEMHSYNFIMKPYPDPLRPPATSPKSGLVKNLLMTSSGFGGRASHAFGEGWEGVGPSEFPIPVVKSTIFD